MTNLSSAAITTPEQCVTACCAAKFTCNVAQWCAAGAGCPTPGCFGGDEHAQPSCPDSAGWVNFLVNWAPAPPPAPPVPQQLSLPKVLDSSMVLQRAPKTAQVWGWATPASSVAISLDNQSVAQATADATGLWRAMLPAQPASTGHTLQFTAAGSTITLDDIAFGDVFLCAGQSHMTFSVNQDMNATETIAQSAAFPGIRHLTVDTDTSVTPLADIRRVKYAANSSWLVSDPSTFGTGLFSYPSAICYYFGRSLYTHFNGTVPIGLVSASVGGSAIEFWTSAKARADGNVAAGTCGGNTAKLADGCLQPIGTSMDDRSSRDEKTESSDVASGASCLPDDSICFKGSPFVCCSGTCSDNQRCEHSNSTAAVTASQASGVAADGQPSGVAVGGWTPGCFFNAMISPFQYMQLRGVLWDQGEANYGDNCLTYGCKLSALAYDWRTNLFNQPDILFTFDQLRADAMAQGTGTPSYADAIPHSTFSSRVDLQTCFANDTSSGHAIRKLEVGRRLSLAARVVEFGEAPTDLSFGPMISGVAAEAVPIQDSSQQALLNVTINLRNGAGLHHSDAPECIGCCKGWTEPLTQGVPATGDAWVLVFESGARAAVCKDKNISTACTGSALIVSDQADQASVNILMLLVNQTSLQQEVISHVQYGGDGPWFTERRADAVKCIYPHSLRFGIEACALYNGVGGYDDHAGVAMPAQLFKASKDSRVVRM